MVQMLLAAAPRAVEGNVAGETFPGYNYKLGTIFLEDTDHTWF